MKGGKDATAPRGALSVRAMENNLAVAGRTVKGIFIYQAYLLGGTLLHVSTHVLGGASFPVSAMLSLHCFCAAVPLLYNTRIAEIRALLC